MVWGGHRFAAQRGHGHDALRRECSAQNSRGSHREPVHPGPGAAVALHLLLDSQFAQAEHTALGGLQLPGHRPSGHEQEAEQGEPSQWQILKRPRLALSFFNIFLVGALVLKWNFLLARELTGKISPSAFSLEQMELGRLMCMYLYCILYVW